MRVLRKRWRATVLLDPHGLCLRNRFVYLYQVPAPALRRWTARVSQRLPRGKEKKHVRELYARVFVSFSRRRKLKRFRNLRRPCRRVALGGPRPGSPPRRRALPERPWATVLVAGCKFCLARPWPFR